MASGKVKLLQRIVQPLQIWANKEPTNIYTAASDSRVCDLATFLESAACFPRLRIHVIPFHDDIPLCRALAAVYGVEVTAVDPLWDELGRSLFADKVHRKSAPSWCYFRKFNVFTLASGGFIFIDANTVILQDISRILVEGRRFDIIFGHRSLPGRNFTPLGHYFFNRIKPRMRHGFGADFWAVQANSLRPELFVQVASVPRIEEMLSIAPEQSLLNAGIAVSRARVGLVHQLRGRGSYSIIQAGRLKPPDDLLGTSVVKWTGDYHSGRRDFSCREVHRPFAEKALSRCSRNTELHRHLEHGFRTIFGHQHLLKSDNAASVATTSTKE